MGDFFFGFAIGIFLILATLWIVGVFNMNDDEYEDDEEDHNDEQE